MTKCSRLFIAALLMLPGVPDAATVSEEELSQQDPSAGLDQMKAKDA